MRATRRRLESPGLERVTFGDRMSRSGWRPGPRDRSPSPAQPLIAELPSVVPLARSVMDAGPHWNAWSRAAIRLMEARNAAFVTQHALQGRTARWNLDDPRLVFLLEGGEMVADLCVIGSVLASDGLFRWAWANRAIPPNARRDLDRVLEFGDLNALDALTTTEWPAGQTEAFELAAVAARILAAEAVWMTSTSELTLFFALSNPRGVAPSAPY